MSKKKIYFGIYNFFCLGLYIFICYYAEKYTFSSKDMVKRYLESSNSIKSIKYWSDENVLEAKEAYKYICGHYKLLFPEECGHVKLDASNLQYGTYDQNAGWRAKVKASGTLYLENRNDRSGLEISCIYVMQKERGLWKIKQAKDMTINTMVSKDRF